MPISDWATLCVGARWGHDFTSYAWTSGVQGGLRWFRMYPIEKCFQAPLMGSREAEEPGFDAGMFYGLEQTTGARVWAERITLPGIAGDAQPNGSAGEGGSMPQWLELNPLCTQNDLAPAYDPTQTYIGNAAVYRTPFIYNRGGSAWPPDNTNSLAWWMLNSVGTWDLYHYQPWAWSGRAPHVIASIVMQAGLAEAYIDTASFDDAYDAYDLTTGDAPWTSLAREMTLYAWRRVGQTVADLVLEVAKHTRDYVCFDMTGRLRLCSKTRPTQVAASSLAGIIRPVRWTMTCDHMYNSYAASYGHVWRQWGQPLNYADAYDTLGVAEEPNQNSERAGKWTRSASDADSIAALGAHPLPGGDVLMSYGGQPVKVKRAHLPFLYDDGDGDLPQFGEWLEVYAWPLHEVTLIQDLRGIDIAPGDQVLDLAVTSDGVYIDARCIEKEIDWRTLRVTSVLLEEASRARARGFGEGGIVDGIDAATTENGTYEGGITDDGDLGTTVDGTYEGGAIEEF